MLKRGETVCLAGEAGEQVYIVKSGAVKALGRSPEGTDVILGLLAPGDLFGELAPTGECPEEQVVQAAVDSVVCTVPRDVFLTMIADAPPFALQVTKLMGLRLRRFSSRVEELLGKSASARLAHTLLDLARQHGIPDADGVLIPLRLSQGDLGKLVGLTRETGVPRWPAADAGHRDHRDHRSHGSQRGCRASRPRIAASPWHGSHRRDWPSWSRPRMRTGPSARRWRRDCCSRSDGNSARSASAFTGTWSCLFKVQYVVEHILSSP